MKKFILPLLLLLAIGMLAAVESDPSAVVGYVKYDCETGLNFIALPMNQAYALASDIGADYAGLIDGISIWEASTQTWNTAVYYEDFAMWDPDPAIATSNALMISALSNFSFYSIGSLPISNAQYSLVQGRNAIMVPLNKADLLSSDMLGTNVGTLDGVSEWLAVSQTWNSSVYYVDFEMWDPTFNIGIGKPLMVNALSSSTWPTRGLQPTLQTKSK